MGKKGVWRCHLLQNHFARKRKLQNPACQFLGARIRGSQPPMPPRGCGRAFPQPYLVELPSCHSTIVSKAWEFLFFFRTRSWAHHRNASRTKCHAPAAGGSVRASACMEHASHGLRNSRNGERRVERRRSHIMPHAPRRDSPDTLRRKIATALRLAGRHSAVLRALQSF